MSFHEAYEADLLVVGSGVAGSYAALAAAELGVRVVMITKRGLLSGSTPWAQGGIAFPVGREDVGQHVADTVKAGRGLSDPEVARELLDESLDHLSSLIKKGMKFDPGLAREGGHSRARVMHAGGDRSGLFLLNFLHQHLPSRIKILENRFVFRLAVDDNGVHGAYFVDDSKRVGAISAGATLLATGGSGQLFEVTTNPSEATGDGVALALMAGCVVRDMELLQFHPTALLDGTLVSEACRGEGAKLINAAGEPFMARYDSEAELAPRDVVARAVYSEIKRTGGVFIDLSLIDDFAEKFPTVSASIEALGLDFRSELVPIAPAAHYQMGGIRTDSEGRTGVGRLYAAGEVGSTGLQGANRLASNSLLEALVMGARSAACATKDLEPTSRVGLDEPDSAKGVPKAKRSEIQRIMSQSCSVIRSGHDLEAGLGAISSITHSPSLDPYELENSNLLLLATCAIQGALEREESRGSHYRSDFPEPSEVVFHVEQTMDGIKGVGIKRDGIKRDGIKRVISRPEAVPTNPQSR